MKLPILAIFFTNLLLISQSKATFKFQDEENCDEFLSYDYLGSFPNETYCPNENGIITFVINSYRETNDNLIPLIGIRILADYNLTLSTLQYIDETNFLENVEPNCGWNAFGCKEESDSTYLYGNDDRDAFLMKDGQREETGDAYVKWDRGHLSSLHLNKFHESAMEGFYSCVNTIPQERYTKRGPWNLIEEQMYHFVRRNVGYIMSGTCLPDDKTAGGVTIPSCLWKMVCYKDYNNGNAYVHGYYDSNLLIHFDDDIVQERRRREVVSIRSQDEILLRFMENEGDEEIFLQGWDQAGLLLQNRRNPGITPPTSEECKYADVHSIYQNNENNEF